MTNAELIARAQQTEPPILRGMTTHRYCDWCDFGWEDGEQERHAPDCAWPLLPQLAAALAEADAAIAALKEGVRQRHAELHQIYLDGANDDYNEGARDAAGDILARFFEAPPPTRREPS